MNYLPAPIQTAYQNDPRLALAKMLQGNQQPVKHWAQGLSNLANAFVAAKKRREVQDDYQGQAEQYQQTLAKALEHMQGGDMEAVTQTFAGNPYTSELGFNVAMKNAQAEAEAKREAAAKLEEAKRTYKDVDAGNEIIRYNGLGEEVTRIPKGLSPDQAADNEFERFKFSNPSASARLNADTRLQAANIRANAQGQKPPAGYRWSADGQSLESIPGGPSAVKEEKESAANEKRVQSELQRAELVTGKIDEALDQASGWTTGFTGAVGRKVPGTDAFDLKNTVETIKANIGFAELQAMREASPTGGALGQVAVQELVALQSTLSSLDTAQSEEQLKSNLEKVKTHYNNWKSTVQQANAQAGDMSPAENVIDWNDLN
jgi:hypothetical protein